MKPLSRRKRKIYLLGLFLAFVVLLPILLFYASGYRLSENFDLVKTGGLYIGVGETGADVYVDGKFIKRTSLLDRDAFVQDLLPGSHSILVEKDGRFSWEKDLRVAEQRVTEAYPFLVKIKPEVARITDADPNFASINLLFSTSTTDTTVKERKPENEDIFAGTLLKEKGGMYIWQDGNAIYARWAKGLDDIPLFFCSVEGLCKERLAVFGSQIALRHFDFHPRNNRIVFVATGTGVFAVEIDDRATKNIVPLYDQSGALFRVANGKVYIKDRGLLYELTL